MDNKSYYISKSKTKKDTMFLEYEKMDGYQVNPKVNKKGAITVNKIVFVNPELSEKIIRKKIDKRINYLLSMLKEIDDDDSGDIGTIQKTLIDAEKLRLQIINEYVKYLGNTYESLTLKKIELIIEKLRFKLYTIKEIEREEYYYNQKENGRGRWTLFFSTVF